MSSVSLLVALTVSWSCATAMRSEGGPALKTEMSGGGSNSSLGWSGCPAECSQCCPAPYDSWLAGLFYSSHERYKCVLKHADKLPDTDACKETEKRTSSGGQSKTKCNFSPEQIKDEAWEELAKTPCSKETTCCCDETDAWTESKCMPLDNTASTILLPSSHEQAEDGVKQTYRRQKQTENSNEATCLRSDSTPLEFSQPPDVKPDEPYNKTWKQTLSSHNRCCIRTRKESKIFKVNCRQESYHCRKANRASRCHRKTCDDKTFHWTGCEEYEQLFHCSTDGGVTQTEQWYARISAETGTCVQDDKCPIDWSPWVPKTSRRCKCDVDCGR